MIVALGSQQPNHPQGKPAGFPVCSSFHVDTFSSGQGLPWSGCRGPTLLPPRTQYVYESVISDNVGLDSTAGLTITRLGGATAAISIQAAKTKLADTIANGGAGTVFGVVKGVSGRATVVIAPDEKTMQVSITDATGRGVMNATMTGPAATTPNTLINWTCLTGPARWPIKSIRPPRRSRL